MYVETEDVEALKLSVKSFDNFDQMSLAQRLAKRLCGKRRQAYLARYEEIAGLLDEYCLGVPLEREAVRADWLAVYVALLVAVLIRLGLFPSIPW